MSINIKSSGLSYIYCINILIPYIICLLKRYLEISKEIKSSKVVACVFLTFRLLI